MREPQRRSRRRRKLVFESLHPDGKQRNYLAINTLHVNKQVHDSNDYSALASLQTREIGTLVETAEVIRILQQTKEFLDVTSGHCNRKDTTLFV